MKKRCTSWKRENDELNFLLDFFFNILQVLRKYCITERNI